LVPRSKFWILAAGLLIIAILIEFGPWFGGSPASAPPSNAAKNIPAKLRTLVTSPALRGSQALPDNFRKVEICGFGKVALDPTDPNYQWVDQGEVFGSSSADDFNAMVEQFSGVRRGLQDLANERTRQNTERMAALGTISLDQFLSQGLMEAQSLLVLDLERCTRCDACVRACADAHDGITRLVREGQRFDRYLIATSCRHCKDPLCMVGCPVGSIRRRNSLEVIIEDWCVGCGLCATNCPYGNINLQQIVQESSIGAAPKPVVRKATSCDLCHNLPEPSCVYACPHDAAHRVKPDEFFADFLKSQSAGLQSIAGD